MEQTQKNKSLVNVSPMPKSKGKGNYEKALEYYNLQGKSAVQGTKRINYNPIYSIKRKNGLVEKKKKAEKATIVVKIAAKTDGSTSNVPSMAALIRGLPISKCR